MAHLLSPPRLALAVAAALYGGAAHADPATPVASSPSQGGTLEEITVTARKRAENLQEVPQSIDVFTSKDLQNLAITRFEDYATKTPSVSFISIGPGTQYFFMRGVSDDMWSDLRVVDRHGFGRSLQPAYEISNLRLGVESPDAHWQAEAYISNMFNTNAVVFTNTGNYDHRETTNTPRVYGVRLSYRFGKGAGGGEE